MKFKTKTAIPETIEIERNGNSVTIKFYPADLRVRQAFYEAYEKLKEYKVRDITPTVDRFGVSNKELEEARELRRFTDFLSQQVDEIFGEGVAQLITDGRCIPDELIRFICETAKYFSAASEKLIKKYIADDESGVME